MGLQLRTAALDTPSENFQQVWNSVHTGACLKGSPAPGGGRSPGCTNAELSTGAPGPWPTHWGVAMKNKA